ncbi:MAG: IS30 family transposase [Paludibacter sp.]|nr:IS30 family transposase [Paludibacter sp.]
MSHITREQRYTIYSMLQKGYNQTEIASVINKNKSVVSREIRRNADARSGQYKDDLAHRKYLKRQEYKAKPRTFTPKVEEYVRDKLRLKYSPEQIAGVAKKDGDKCVSHERIYQFVWKNKRQKGTLYLDLRNRGRRYKKRSVVYDKRGTIPNRTDISQRPPEVELRERFGDLEIDLIIGKNHKNAILTINDRVTGLAKLRKLDGKDARQLALATIDCLNDWKPFLKTITSDNGKEFACHQMIALQLNIDFFFAKPYASWQRGSNENYNRLVRQYIPKKVDFDCIPTDYINFVEYQLNNRPRKRFNYESPIFMFNQKVAFST